MRVLFPAATLAVVSPKRAALLLAVDLVTVISEAVVLFSELEGVVRSLIAQGRGYTMSMLSDARSAAKHDGLSQRLQAVNDILLKQMRVLQW